MRRKEEENVTFAGDVEPVAGRVWAELEEGGTAVLVVQPAVDERVDAEYELIALVQLATTHDADETSHVVDLIDSSHHKLVRRYQLQAARTSHAEQPTYEHRRTDLLFVLSTKRRLCFHPCLSVCLSVCLLTDYSKTTDQIFVKFHGMLGLNPGTNRVKSLKGQNRLFVNNSVQNCH